jgi:hypothetical protein
MNKRALQGLFSRTKLNFACVNHRMLNSFRPTKDMAWLPPITTMADRTIEHPR